MFRIVPAHASEGDYVDTSLDERITVLESSDDLVIICLDAASSSQVDCEDTADASVATMNERLRNTLEKISSLFKDNLICERCKLVFYRPFTLRDCGHTFCFSCIRGLFSRAVYDRMVRFSLSPGSQEVITPHTVPRHLCRMVELGIGIPEYKCPTCRCLIEARPVTAFVLRDLVEGMGDVTRLLSLPDEERHDPDYGFSREVLEDISLAAYFYPLDLDTF